MGRLTASMALACLVTPGMAGQVTFRAGVDLVSVDVVVQQDGRAVTDLGPSDFIVTDNGVRQAVVDVILERRPLDLDVFIDASGSLGADERAVVDRSLTELASAVDAMDRISVTSFSSHVSPVVRLGTHDTMSVDWKAASGYGSAVLDALLVALISPRSLDRRRVAMFVTDGADNASRFHHRSLVDTARYSSTNVVALFVGEGAGSSRQTVREVARMGGGDVLNVGRRQQLGPAFLQILQRLRTTYSLRYRPAAPPEAGWHALGVSVDRPGHSVHARSGYWVHDRD